MAFYVCRACGGPLDTGGGCASCVPPRVTFAPLREILSPPPKPEPDPPLHHVDGDTVDGDTLPLRWLIALGLALLTGAVGGYALHLLTTGRL